MAKFFATAFALLLWTCSAVADPSFWCHEWPNTDFSKTSVKSWGEILSGGSPKDGIPALDASPFKRASAERRIAAREPVFDMA